MVRPHQTGDVWQASRSFQVQEWRTLRDLELLAIAPEQIALLQKLTYVWIAVGPGRHPLTSQCASAGPTSPANGG
jgi:hypothetical protein